MSFHFLPYHGGYIQRFTFNGAEWTPERADQWAASRGFRPSKIAQRTGTGIKLRMFPSEHCARGSYVTVPFIPACGISAVVCRVVC